MRREKLFLCIKKHKVDIVNQYLHLLLKHLSIYLEVYALVELV